MQTHIAGGLSWPVRLAYVAAALFILASGGTNLIYGWSKGVDTASSLVWVAVSIAVSIVFSLSWPALLAAIDQWHWARCVMVAIALALSGAYSMSAALGSAAGGRANATIEEKDVTDKRARAQASYDAAKAELASLKPTRTVGELQAMRDGWKRAYPSQPWVLEPELARAKRRAELQAKIESATADLAKITPARQANSDAKALARYLSAIGIDTTPERLNDLLVIFAVLLIECGGGLSLAVGLSLAQSRSAAMPYVEQSGAGSSQDTAGQRGELSGASERVPDTQLSAHTDSNRTGGHLEPDTTPNSATFKASDCPVGADTCPTNEADTPAQSASAVLLLSFLRERGGVLVGGQRAMADAMGWSKTRLNEVLHELKAGGLVQLDTRPTGTVVRLAA